MKFIARFVFAETDFAIASAGLADDQFETRDYVLFQRSLNPSEQDRHLGHDQPHIEAGNQSASGYGNVTSVELCGDQLRINLDPPLDGVGSSIIVYIGTENGLPELAETLSLIFGPRFNGDNVLPPISS